MLPRAHTSMNVVCYDATHRSVFKAQINWNMRKMRSEDSRKATQSLKLIWYCWFYNSLQSTSLHVPVPVAQNPESIARHPTTTLTPCHAHMTVSVYHRWERVSKNVRTPTCSTRFRIFMMAAAAQYSYRSQIATAKCHYVWILIYYTLYSGIFFFFCRYSQYANYRHRTQRTSRVHTLFIFFFFFYST